MNGNAHPIYKYTVMYQSDTTKLYYFYYCIRATCFDSYRIIFRTFWDTDPYWAVFKIWDVLCVYCNGATCFDSYRIIFRPFCDTEPHLAMFKTRCGIPKAYILDITVYKMHVSLCSYCTVGTLVSETLTGTYGGGYTYVLEMSFYRTLDIVIYIAANYKICISEGHEDDSIRIETCCPNAIINIMKFCCVGYINVQWYLG